MEPSAVNTNRSVFRQILTPTFISIFLITCLCVTTYYITFVMMVQYSIQKFGVSTSFAGLITGVVVIGALIGRFASGELVIRLGYKKTLGWSVLLHAVFNFLYLFANNPIAMLLDRLAVGMAIGAVSSVANALAAAIAPPRGQASTIAYFSMSTALAVCIGPFLTISLTGILQADGLFWLCTLMAFFCVGLVIFVREPQEESHGTGKKFAITDCINVSVIPFCLVCALTSMAWANMPAFLASYAQVNNVGFGASLFFVVYAVAMLVSRPFTGPICDRRGFKGVLLFSMASLALGLGCLWVGKSNFLVLVAGILSGLGFGNILSVGQAAIVSMVDRSQYTQATSTWYILLDSGSGSAPYIFGHLVAPLGYNGIFGVSGVLVLSAMPLYLLVARKQGRRD